MAETGLGLLKKWGWLVKIIKLIWSQISSGVREAIIQFVKELEEKAKETGSPWDDALVAILKDLLGID